MNLSYTSQFRALNKNQRSLLWSQLFDSLGDYGIQSSLIVWAATYASSALAATQAVTVLIFANAIPRIAFAPLVSWISSHYPEYKVLVTTDWLRVLACAVIFVVAATGQNIILVASVAFIVSGLDQVFPPSRAAATQRNIRPEERVFVGALSFFLASAMGIFASGLGPLVFSLGGLRLSATIGGILFAASAVILHFGYDSDNDLERRAHPALVGGFFLSYWETSKFAFNNHAVATVTWASVGYGFALGITNQTMAPFAIHSIGISEGAYGLVPGSFAVGGLASFFLSTRFTKKVGPSKMLLSGVVVLAAAYLAFGAASGLRTAMGAMLFAGAGLGVISGAQGPILQKFLTNVQMAPYIAFVGPLSLVASLIGAPIASYVAHLSYSNFGSTSPGYRSCYLLAATFVLFSGLLRWRASMNAQIAAG